MPDRWGEGSERFAEVVDLDDWDDSGVDAALSRQLDVVAFLRGHAADLGPDPATSQRIRSRLMDSITAPATDQPAVAAVRELVGHDHAGRHRRAVPAGPHSLRRRAASSRAGRRVAATRGRPAVAAAAAMCLLLTLSAGSALLSREALPGDALYGVKRAAEAAELGLTFGQEAKANKHLEFAAARLDEIEALASRLSAAGAARDTGSSSEAALITQTLHAFDDEALAATRLLLPLATEGSGADLALVSTWAEQQSRRLAAVRASLPAAARSAADTTLGLLSRVVTRAVALSARMSCQQVAADKADDLGPLPATTGCVARPANGNLAASPGSIRNAPGAPSIPSPPVQDPSTAGQPGSAAPNPAFPGLLGGDGSSHEAPPPLDPHLPGAPTSTPATPTTPPLRVPLPLPGLPQVSLPTLLPGQAGVAVG